MLPLLINGWTCDRCACLSLYSPSKAKLRAAMSLSMRIVPSKMPHAAVEISIMKTRSTSYIWYGIIFVHIMQVVEHLIILYLSINLKNDPLIVQVRNYSGNKFLKFFHMYIKLEIIELKCTKKNEKENIAYPVLRKKIIKVYLVIYWIE